MGKFIVVQDLMENAIDVNNLVEPVIQCWEIGAYPLGPVKIKSNGRFWFGQKPNIQEKFAVFIPQPTI